MCSAAKRTSAMSLPASSPKPIGSSGRVPESRKASSDEEASRTGAKRARSAQTVKAKQTKTTATGSASAPGVGTRPDAWASKR